jgi:acetyl-CoA synthetase
VKWFSGAKTNIAVNALDRHLPERGDQAALIWEGNEPGETRSFTYRQLHEEVGRLANALKSLGVKKGDRVAIYLGMVPELAMSLLACARIGAIHNVIFGGFSADSIRDRVLDAKAAFVITGDGLFRGSKTVPLKPNIDKALASLSQDGHRVAKCLVLKRTGEAVEWQEGRDVWWHDVVPAQKAECPAEPMDAEDPLFILYTSGSTGKPKGVLHSTAGYMVYAATTFRHVFTYQPGEVTGAPRTWVGLPDIPIWSTGLCSAAPPL